MKYLTIIIPYLPSQDNYLEYTLEKHYDQVLSLSVPIDIHIQISQSQNEKALAQTLWTLRKYKSLFLGSLVHLNYSIDADLGVYDAINIAVLSVETTFVCVCGAGDFLNLEILSNTINKIALFDVSIFPVKFLSTGRTYHPPRQFMIAFKNICHQGMIIKTHILKLYPYSLEFPILADYHWNLTYLHLFNCSYFSEILATYDDTCGLSKNSLVKDRNFRSIKNDLIIKRFGIFVAISAFVYHNLINLVRLFK